MRGWFVTGTDTGVGKTVVAAALCRLLRAADLPVVYVKPVQSGAEDGDDDARDVVALAGVPTVTGHVLGASLAPAVAARRVGVTITLDDLEQVVRDATATHDGARVVVEGAGGLLVELGTDGATCADLAGRLGLPVVLVARPGLGTLNHTALTLEALDRRGLDLDAVVVSGFPEDPDLAARTNGAELHRLSAGKLAGVVPALDPTDGDPLADVRGWFAPRLGGGFVAEAWLGGNELLDPAVPRTGSA